MTGKQNLTQSRRRVRRGGGAKIFLFHKMRKKVLLKNARMSFRKPEKSAFERMKKRIFLLWFHSRFRSVATPTDNRKRRKIFLQKHEKSAFEATPVTLSLLTQLI